MPDKTIYLVRHGITRSNRENVYAGWSEEELIEEGVLGAEVLGREMEGLGISVIYTSPINRALQTAQILNKYIRGKLVVEVDFKEMKMGAWEGLSEHEVASRYPSEYKLWLQRPDLLLVEGRETLYEVQKRALRAINRILETNCEGAILVVTHVAIIRCLFLYFNQLFLDLYKIFSVPNLSVHRLSVCQGKYLFYKGIR